MTRRVNRVGPVGLALSGGASASAAHVGVVRAFEDAGISVTHMSGTSGGALVAGLWAAGCDGRDLRKLLARLKRSHFDIDWRAAARRWLMNRRGEWLGLVRASRLERWLESLIGGRQVRDLPRPVALTAVDLASGREVIFASRPLEAPAGSTSASGRDSPAAPPGPPWELIDDIPAATALLASCAVPIVFRPVAWRDRMFVDGGVVDNCPVAPLMALGAPFTVSVDLVSPWGWRSQRQFPGLLPILFRSVNVALAHQSREANARADRVMHPEIPPIALTDFDRLGEIADAAYDWALRALEQWASK